MNDLFQKFSTQTSHLLGSSGAFILAIGLVLLWATTGPYFNYSDTWQLVINTATTVITFLMVFLIQNTQNRDAKATHLKLDEILRSSKTARNSLLNVEDLSDEELENLHEEFKKLRAEYEKRKVHAA